ncbi:MAG TPA: hypothetical protein VMU02_02270 [bacterium]|nr:hypothetical protein [bacterium]
MALRPRVYTAKDARLDPATPEDTYLGKLVKYIPAEVVAAYVAATGAVKSAGADVHRQALLWIIAAGLLVITPIWVLVAATEPGKPRPAFQAGAATAAFACWVFALGGPFEAMTWYKPVYGTVVLIFATLMIPLVEKGFVKAPPAAGPGAN